MIRQNPSREGLMGSRLFVAALSILLAPAPTSARDYEMVSVKAGETADVYFQINLGGTLYLDIRSKDGPGCATLWWIKWPFGTIKNEGRYCGVRRARHSRLAGSFLFIKASGVGGSHRHQDRLQR
jgi:hypothetical protein